MRWITFALTIATVAGLIAYKPPASGQGDGDATPIYGIKIPTGYRTRFAAWEQPELFVTDLRAAFFGIVLPEGGFMSVQTNNLYLLEDLDDASKTGQLANNDLAALRTVAHEARVIRKTYTVL